MARNIFKKTWKTVKDIRFWTAIILIYILAVLFMAFYGNTGINIKTFQIKNIQGILDEITSPQILALDKEDYDAKMLDLANIKTKADAQLWPAGASKMASTTYPLDGAILPFHRIIAYYGNFLSTQMGVLGEYPESQVFDLLNIELQKWDEVDPNTPAIPAIQYIAITAQGYPGDDGKYRLRMPDDQIQKAVDMAKKINGIVILDVQVGQSDLQAEIPTLEKWLAMPQVHLAIDPEFAMKPGQVPGAIYIGTLDAKDINYAINYLSGIVKKYNLPPKVLIVHRFTKNMVTNSQEIETVPEVQVVMNMDGWGDTSGKLAIYYQYIYKEPVEFTGIKLFYNNDLRNGSTMLTPEDIMNLTPRPIYIQYQ